MAASPEIKDPLEKDVNINPKRDQILPSRLDMSLASWESPQNHPQELRDYGGSATPRTKAWLFPAVVALGGLGEPPLNSHHVRDFLMAKSC